MVGRSLLLLVLLLLPAAQAIESVRVDGPDRSIAPDQESVPFTVTTVLDCADVFPRTAVAVMRIDFAFDAPEGIIITGPQSMLILGERCTGPIGLFEQVASFHVAVTREVPGEELLGATVTVTVPGDAAHADETEAAEFSVMAAYFARLQADVVDRVVTAHDGAVVVPVDLTNHGNAPTRLHWSADSATVTAEDVVLQSPSMATAGTQATVPVNLGGVKDGQTVRLVVTPVSPVGTQGPPAPTITLLVEETGLFKAVPAPPLLLALAAALARRS